MPSRGGSRSTINLMALNDTDRTYLDLAIEQAQLGWDEGGVPIGAALVHHGPEGDRVLAVGRNRRVQDGSVIRHGETDCLERAGRLPASVYRECTLYTTLSPCTMCAGTAILYDIPRIVIGENQSFEASEEWLRSNGTELVIAEDPSCLALMQRMMDERPEVWAEDIGVETDELGTAAAGIGPRA
ncbi:Cytosine deaminase [Leucobacter sp. 7(1)]|nr:Cytosine deaminase [Leucobacter sp. 7(1)]